MPITEIALLRVKNPNKYGDAILKLFHAAEEQWRWSLYPIRAFRQVEDPTLVYLFGGWKSVVAHLEDWLPSAQNKAALESIKEYLEIVWMFHVDIEPCKHLGILNAPSIAINRYFVKRSRKSDFGALFKVRQTRLEEIADDPDPNFTGGWRIDNYGGDEEFFSSAIGRMLNNTPRNSSPIAVTISLPKRKRLWPMLR
ncbi:hypothetical protein N7539_001046 [Penicillium diatomitis]|uniref:Uncharacterized protein n=1 Tax=Penicillium diatomitis TaxID=2819901 RepID=A0A9W9XNP2_9EURO|nr:uncharacterized protein N7539_001046 [Penicillium diatomitis]KAJ5495930.1 hypothetical protein N7539_001046 [Penicillium diatomitis]